MASFAEQNYYVVWALIWCFSNCLFSMNDMLLTVQNYEAGSN